MGFDFRETVQVITGGASGIGLAFAENLQRRGATVILADVNRASLDTARDRLNLPENQICTLDVQDHDAVEALADTLWRAFGRIDGVFNNAGVGAPRPFLRTRPEDFDWVFGVNVRGVWSVARVFAERLAAQSTPGLIVNTASEHGLGVPHLNNAIYTASKHAVLGLSDVMRSEMPDHIQVSVFCPGLTRSGFWDAGRARPDKLGGPKPSTDIAKNIQDLGMTAEDVADRALNAIEAGAFYIVTHAHNREMVTDRYREQMAAFDRQTSDTDGDAYDVNTVMERIFGESAPARPLWARNKP